ncbi:MAG TPA: hypothetical protein VMM85_02845 [Methylomirabilota bacterium]|nr:hypothetical protein [Methylomirabilota bacterium]
MPEIPPPSAPARPRWLLRWRIRSAVAIDRRITPGRPVVSFGLYREGERRPRVVTGPFTAEKLRRRIGSRTPAHVVGEALAQLDSGGLERAGGGDASKTALEILRLTPPPDLDR